MDDALLEEQISRLSDHDGMVRERARLSLVFMGSQAVPSLLELLESKHKHTRWEAARTLAAIADPGSMDALVMLLTDRESDLRWIGSMGLIKIGPPCIPMVLEELIGTPDSTDLRRAVHHVLYDLASNRQSIAKDVEPVIEALGESAPAETVILRARQALERLGSTVGMERSDW